MIFTSNLSYHGPKHLGTGENTWFCESKYVYLQVKLPALKTRYFYQVDWHESCTIFMGRPEPGNCAGWYLYQLVLLPARTITREQGFRFSPKKLSRRRCLVFLPDLTWNCVAEFNTSLGISPTRMTVAMRNVRAYQGPCHEYLVSIL